MVAPDQQKLSEIYEGVLYITHIISPIKLKCTVKRKGKERKGRVFI